MAVTTSNGTGGGNWSAGASWAGGVAPPTTNDVTIASGDTITKDTAEGTPDCVNLIVTGTLDIGANGVKASGTFDGTGVVKITTGRLWSVGGWPFNTNTCRYEIVGTSGNHAELTSGSGLFINDPPSGYHSIKWCDFAHGASLRFFTSLGSVFEDCVFPAVRFYNGAKVVLTRCTIGSGGGTNLFGNAIYLRMDGGTIAGTLEFDSITAGYENNDIELHGVTVSAGTYITRASASKRVRIVVQSQGHNAVAGDWRIDYSGGYTLKSTTSKNTQTYGVEMVPTADCSVFAPVILEMFIPVSSGDTIAPSVTLKNVTADLGLTTADRAWAILDPGNEWGRYEKIDLSTLATLYNNWRTLTFTGGVVGGTSKKGTCLLRIVLVRYVSTAVLYVADLDDGVT